MKPMGKAVSQNAKHVAETLMKPVENEDFGTPFSETALEMIQKALPREGFRNVFSKRRKPL